MSYLMRLLSTIQALRHYCSLLLLAALVTACGSTPTTQAPTLSLDNLPQEIASAEQLSSPDKDNRFIELASQLYELAEIEQASSLIARVDSNQLDDDQYLNYITVASNIYSADQAIFQSSELLNNDRLKQLWDRLTIEQQQQLHRQKADTYSQLGNAQDSIIERIALDQLLIDTLDITENHEALWQELSQLSVEQLKALETSTEDPISRGWYQLAGISKQNQGNLEVKRIEVNKWTSVNPTHPASLELPMDLQLLNTLIEQRPRKVALLLPMQGKLAIAGKTIRDGFFAAYYNQEQGDKPEISLYDTSQESVNSLYDKAVSEGANLVIGPLEKNKVIELQQRDQLPITTLALNYSNNTSVSNNTNSDNVDENSNTDEFQPANEPVFSKPLYQFGLSLEDEATQAADRAWLEGHRYAMVVSSKADWSKRAVNAFIKRWQERGGKVIVNREFTAKNSYSNTIKSAFAIDQSQARARKLKRLFGKNFEFEPRRRQDIDMIFLVARSSEGQQIKPTLAFHYAGNIPVYATSQIYSSSQSIGKNRDLNGIRFTTLPWTLDPENRDKNLVTQKLKIPPNYERLYAMGIDAFLLHDRLNQLARLPNTSIFGTTGKLRLDDEKRIVREQPWAEIVKGEAKPLPYLTQDSEDFFN